MITFLSTTQKEREPIFQAWLTDLKRSSYRHFLHFEFSPTLSKEMNMPNLGLTDLLLDWHKGLGPGVALPRSRNEVAALTRTLTTMQAHAGHFHYGNIQSVKLDTPEPTLPQSFPEFLDYLERHAAIVSWILTPGSQYALLLRAVYGEVTSLTSSVYNVNHWYGTHGPYILWSLVLEAKAFFGQTRTAASWFH